ncbi:hypothetical protein I5M32_07970 [Pedobacter sp. SD-b]|uniref:Glycosyl hydrolase family 71 n=1 Tax=Pedobacter segetis TaxID=2793069 RepID=A0ABS1BJ27_9SPHI|nr:hypothetical protein [Pedobacter segetis]MBK0382894.1 hypothetical protein [Pedobacter segetis]
MKKSFSKKILWIIICTTFVHLNLSAQETSKNVISSSKADTWVATDGLGRVTPIDQPKKDDKYVGIFYFIWQGAHGYDEHGKGMRKDEGVIQKSGDEKASPYDISKMLKANPDNPQYGPIYAFHHWGEPYFGYYLPDDEWIIRKHAQMLSDAGVDVIILDVTNAAIYLPQVTKIATVYREMRKQGLSTPYFAFIVNSKPVQTVNRLYDSIYEKGLFKDLWFYWKGKPLLLAPPENQSQQIKDFFNIRQSWAWSKNQEWFGDGKDKWTWLDHTPQSYGWHENKDIPEEISVSVAEHPVSNIGRSFHDGKEPAIKESGKGLYFNEQWKRALEVNPEFVFVTGWNEWVAMRFNNGAAKNFLGKPIKKGDTYFVDLYNQEYSRDTEPMAGGFADNYYYQLVDNIRKYKGTREIPSFTGNKKIKIDGDFKDWDNVSAEFYDDKGDTFHRNHPGYGSIKEYINNTGRNDIVKAKVAADEDYISFYVETAQPITGYGSPNWMNLFIDMRNRMLPDWEGYQFLVNANPKDKKTTSLAKSLGGWKWENTANVAYRVSGNKMEVKIPKKSLNINSDNFTIDFKWADNVPANEGVINFLDKGDAAPNARFNYRYIHKENK